MFARFIQVSRISRIFSPLLSLRQQKILNQARFSSVTVSSSQVSQETLFSDAVEEEDNEEEEEPSVKPESAARIHHELKGTYAVGRRKTSSAKVWIRPGSGQFTVNGRNLIHYFQPSQREHCLMPFLETSTAGYFDVECSVVGGGVSGQAGAVRLGISRALNLVNPSLRKPLKKAGFLTRDARRVERKKPGQKKARKQYQWVKR